MGIRRQAAGAGLAMVVNILRGDATGNGNSVDPVYKPSKNQAVYRVNVDCRPVDRSSTLKKQPASYLNNGREYALTKEGAAGILQIRKAERHVESTPKINVENRNPGLRAVWGIGNDPKAVLRCLGSAREGLGSFFVYWFLTGKQERCLIMSTTQNPSFVCDTLHSSPVNQRSTDWESLQPQQTSDQAPDQMEWPIYMIAVPTDWEPKSGSALPPNAKRFNSGRVAVEVAAMLNREILKQSTDGTVQSWYVRISKRSERQGVVSVSIPAYLVWKPADEHDRPPAQLTIKGMLADARHEVAAMNQALSNDQYKAHRFFIGFSISAVPEWDPKPAQPETVEADPASKQDAKPEKQKTPFKDKRVSKRETGPVYLIDVPSDYQPFSWKSFPGMFQRLKCLPIAKLAAIEGNQRILDRSQNGTVKAWYIVIEISGGFGIVQITPPEGWKPVDAYDMPEALSVIQDRIERTAYIKTLNQQLDRITNKKTRKRAYSALRVFRPETRGDQPEAKPEPQAVPQTMPADQKPVKRYQFTGELVSVSDSAEQRKQSINRILQNMQ
jgi:hypothetical protein